MKEKIIFTWWFVAFFTVLIGGLNIACAIIQNRIDASYKTGVTITPSPDYRIELYYSDDTTEDKMSLQIHPRRGSKLVTGYYTTPRPMHLWYWVLMLGDEEVYRETIDRDVRIDDSLKFTYVRD